MPNHVTVTVYAQNQKALREHFFTEKEGEGLVVDFNKVIPIPQDLYKVSSPSQYEYIGEQGELLLQKFPIKNYTIEEYVAKVKIGLLNKDKELLGGENYYEDTIKGYYNYTKYGYSSWYDWCIDNWDTKWNAYDCYVGSEDSDIVTFNTAWSYPEKVLLKLSEYTPITVMFADEDYGNNYGIVKMEDGEITETLISEDDNNDYYFRLGESLACSGYSSLEDYLDNSYFEDEEESEEDDSKLRIEKGFNYASQFAIV